MPTSVLKEEDEDGDVEVLELKERLAAYNLHSSPDGSSSGNNFIILMINWVVHEDIA